jgi:hypothetical protein
MTDDLLHYGVPGMRWGVRKQDSGSRKQKKTDPEREKKNAVREDRKKAYKNASTLSDKEIEARLKRLRTEQEFKKLSQESLAPGKTATKLILTESGSRTMKQVAAGAGAIAAGAIITKLVSDPDASQNARTMMKFIGVKTK